MLLSLIRGKVEEFRTKQPGEQVVIWMGNSFNSTKLVNSYIA